MKIKLILNPQEAIEVQRLSRADFQSPTQWVSKMLVRHLQALKKREMEANPLLHAETNTGAALPK